MMEKQHQIALSRQACLKAATSGPSSLHMMAGLVSMDRPCSAYSGKTTRSMVPRLRRALPTSSTMRAVCCCRSAGVSTTGSCNCTKPMTTPFSDLFNPPRPDMAVLLFGDGKLARHVPCCALAAGRGDHDEKRQDVGRGIEEVVALGNAHRLQGRADGSGGAEQQGGPDAAHRIPAGKDHQGHRHQALAG